MASRLGAAATATVASLGQGFGVVSIVGEGHPHLDGLSLLAVGEGIGGAGGSVDVRLVGQPLVAVGHVGQPVHVVYGRCVRRERMVHLRCASNGGKAGGRRVLRLNDLLRDATSRGALGLGGSWAVAHVVGGYDPHGVFHASGQVGDGVGGTGFRSFRNVGRGVPAVRCLLPLHLVADDGGTAVGCWGLPGQVKCQDLVSCCYGQTLGAVGTVAATTTVATLVRVSLLSASSVKVTRTWMVCPAHLQ